MRKIMNTVLNTVSVRKNSLMDIIKKAIRQPGVQLSLIALLLTAIAAKKNMTEQSLYQPANSTQQDLHQASDAPMGINPASADFVNQKTQPDLHLPSDPSQVTKFEPNEKEKAVKINLEKLHNNFVRLNCMISTERSCKSKIISLPWTDPNLVGYNLNDRQGLLQANMKNYSVNYIAYQDKIRKLTSECPRLALAINDSSLSCAQSARPVVKNDTQDRKPTANTANGSSHSTDMVSEQVATGVN